MDFWYFEALSYFFVLYQPSKLYVHRDKSDNFIVLHLAHYDIVYNTVAQFVFIMPV